jgi:plasmid rolling circle replication initiator protein Rep
LNEVCTEVLKLIERGKVAAAMTTIAPDLLCTHLKRQVTGTVDGGLLAFLR